jgi:opacity protein-like surface antigen
MRQLAFLAWCFLVAAIDLTAAAQAESSWYVSGSAGAYLREDASGNTTITNGVTSAPGTNRSSFDAGPIVNLAVGYRLPARFRVEVEAGYATYLRSTINPVSAGFPQLTGADFNRESGGRFNNYSATINLFYDIPIDDQLVPYVGGGIGGVHRDLSRGVYVSNAGLRFNEAGGSGDFGIALVEAGLSIGVGHNLSIVPAYRYIRFFANTPATGDEAAHVLKIGLRYDF